MTLAQHMKNEPKELAQFASDAYHIGIMDALEAVQRQFPQIANDQLIEIHKTLQQQAFHAVEWRRNVEWIEGIDHSISPSKTYVSMPIERYRELKALETK